MNPALLHQSYHIEYPLNADSKYLSSERPYSSSAAPTANDFSQIDHKSQNGLSNPQLGHTLGLPNNHLEYSSHQLIPENTYHSNQQLLLSPPSSIASDGIQPSSSALSFSASSKLAASNASSTDQFSSSASSFLPSAWNDSTMTEFNRPFRAPMVPPTLSPPLSYGPSNNLSNPYINQQTRMIDPYTNPFSHSRSFHTSDITSSILSGRQQRSPTFGTNLLPVPAPTSHAMHPTFQPMQAQPPSQPQGPPFDDTKRTYRLVDIRNQPVNPEISASIQKGFFQVEGKWTCYRRNYFTVSCAFNFKNGPQTASVYLQRSTQPELVQEYAVSISARTANGSNHESEHRQLVQHTPKRDKATESTPTRHVVQPATNSGMPAALYGGSQQMPSAMLGGFEGFGSQNQNLPPTSHTFERIQFQKATANNGKRRAQQQYFHVVVELSVRIGNQGTEDDWVLVATRQSHPMVVRGRSPGHYKDNVRRDSQANMDPDRGSGTGGEGGPSNHPMPPMMGSQPSSMDWTPTHRHHQPYGNSYSRDLFESDFSPQSTDSSTGLTRSSSESDFPLHESGPPNGRLSYIFERPLLRQNKDRNGIRDPGHQCSEYHSKGQFEDEESDNDDDGTENYFSGTAPVDENFAPHTLDLGSMTSAKPLCAST